MTDIYRLTVRTVDGTRYISDYTNLQMAETRRNKFLAMNNAIAYNWKEGDVSARIILDKLTSLSIQKITIPIDEKNFSLTKSNLDPCEFNHTYLDTIEIKEVA